jgi:RNA polymerase sigma factor (sigma-70 family)
VSASETADATTVDLLALARSGDGRAFTELVDRHHGELVRIAYVITGDLDAARDSAQLAWIKAWQRLSSVREPDRLRAWLIAIAANEARQHLRAHRRRRVREIVPAAHEDHPVREAATASSGTWRRRSTRGRRPGSRRLRCIGALA